MADPHARTAADAVQNQTREQLLERFTADLHANGVAKIEDYLSDFTGNRADLLHSLLSIEIQTYKKLGEPVGPDQYLTRFPDDHNAVNSAFNATLGVADPIACIAEFRQLWLTTPALTAEVFASLRGIKCTADLMHALMKEELELRLTHFEKHVVSDKPVGLPERIGRYQIEAFISQGAFGSVFRAKDPNLERTIAIKTPRSDLDFDQEMRNSFERETRLICRLEHPHILPVYDFGLTEFGQPYLVMKLVETASLNQRLANRSLSFVQATTILSSIARALHYAHGHNVVHRDVKPDNILVDQNDHAWLTDFGIGIEGPDISRAVDSSGTPLYWSPEQAAGKSHLVDGRSDVFSLGTILYEAITGINPFQAKSLSGIIKRIVEADVRPPRQINDRIPIELEAVCMRAMQRNPMNRYTTAADMAEDLDDVPSYIPRPIDTKHVQLSDDLIQLMEILAINTHEIWSSKRLSEGWIAGPKRDDKKKTHPGLVPFEQLEKTEQDYDREIVEAVMKASIALGTKIIPPCERPIETPD